MKRNFYEFCRAELESTKLAGLYERAMRYYKPLRMIRRVFSVIYFSVTLLGAGVALLVLTVLSLVVLPILVLSWFALLILSMLGIRRAKRQLSAELAGRGVEVIFPTRESLLGSEFLRGWAKSGGDGLLIVVSPYFISPRGIFGKKQYLTLRKESERVILIRRFAYFRLREPLKAAARVVCYF